MNGTTLNSHVHQCKVLIVSPHFTTKGGIQNYCKTIHTKLASDVEMFFIGPKRENEPGWLLLPRLVSGNVRFLLRLMRGGVDVVHINTSLVSKSLLREGVLLLVTRLFPVKTLVFFHGWSKDVEKTVGTTFRQVFRWVFGSTDLVIVLAQDFKAALRRIGLMMPIQVETTFVDDHVFGSLDEEAITRRTNGTIHRPTLLFLSRVLRAKGIFETLAAFALVKKNHPDVRLIVAGEGEDMEEAKRVVASGNLADVDFVGFVHDERKKAVLLESDVYILPTQYGEGLPISMVEAMICGLPVLTRPVGGIPDFFEDKKMGFLINGLEAREYAASIELLLSNTEMKQTISLYNHRYARTRFMSTTAAGRLDAYYNELRQGLST
ncbi:MAG: glycosyltransferase family 4 protein [Bacteroidota bacterium]